MAGRPSLLADSQTEPMRVQSVIACVTLDDAYALLNNPDREDLFRLVCWKSLGSGCYRHVFEFNDTKVIKYELSSGKFANIAEYNIWKHLKENCHPAMKWFAPCTAISPNGVWLVQERTTPVPIEILRKEVPRVPAYCTDLKAQNWGRLGKRIVCHDYAELNKDLGLSSLRMRKADWWDADKS